eukprot:2913091-Pleurochrysis_carterae.AAC.1
MRSASGNGGVPVDRERKAMPRVPWCCSEHGASRRAVKKRYRQVSSQQALLSGEQSASAAV